MTLAVTMNPFHTACLSTIGPHPRLTRRLFGFRSVSLSNRQMGRPLAFGRLASLLRLTLHHVGLNSGSPS